MGQILFSRDQGKPAFRKIEDIARSDLFMVLIITYCINFIDVEHVYTLASFNYQHRVLTQEDHCSSTQRNLQTQPCIAKHVGSFN